MTRWPTRNVCATSGSEKTIRSGLPGSNGADYYADIIAVPGDPLNGITALQKVAFVRKGGVIFKK